MLTAKQRKRWDFHVEWLKAGVGDDPLRDATLAVAEHLARTEALLAEIEAIVGQVRVNLPEEETRRAVLDIHLKLHEAREEA